MKKIYTLILVLLSLVFVSCSKAKVSSNGCFDNMDSALAQTKKTKQNILLIVTTGSDELSSQEFIDNVLNSPDFVDTIAKKYAVVNMDFSEESYQKTVVKPDATKEEQQASEEYSELMYKNARIASLLSVQSTPAIYLFSKEMCFITEVVPDGNVRTPAELETAISKYNDKIAFVNERVAASEKGSVIEKVTAIDELFEATDSVYKTFLISYMDKVIQIDKKNESGLLNKYILAKANAKATEFFLEGNVEEAIMCFVSITKEAILTGEQKQQAYYMAAYLLAMSGSIEYDRICDYLQKSIEAAPDSQEVSGIEMFKNYVESAKGAE